MPEPARRPARALGAGGLAVLTAGALLLSLASCTSKPPRQPDDICKVFQEKPGWYKAARKAEKRWGLPVAVSMAFVHRESSYIAKARPEREKLLWVIPWKRPSSAYGYAQITDEAWSDYRKTQGSWLSERDDIDDALDFIGWYNDRSHRALGLRKDDAYHLYLAYYSGITGYRRGGWKRNAAVKEYANKVRFRANAYAKQLARCESKLKKSRWFF